MVEWKKRPPAEGTKRDRRITGWVGWGDGGVPRRTEREFGANEVETFSLVGFGLERVRVVMH